MSEQVQPKLRRWQRIVAGAGALFIAGSASIIGLEIAIALFQVYRVSTVGDRYVEEIGESALPRLYPGWSLADVKHLWNETYLPLIYEPYTGFRERPRQGRFVNVAPGGYRENVGHAPWPEDPAAVNIFVFGGSTTFGYGVADWETIPSAIQSALGASRCGASLRVYNFGRGHYYSTQERVLFERLLTDGHHPTAAVFIDGYNDSDNGDDAQQFASDFSRLFAMQQGEAGFIATATGTLAITTSLGRSVRRIAERWTDDTHPGESEQAARGRKAANRWATSVKLVEAGAREAGIVPLVVVQPVRAYRYDLSSHPMKKYVNDDPWLAAGRAFYEEIDARRKDDRALREVLWLGDAQVGEDQSSVYVDGGHYSAQFSVHLGREIAQHLAHRLPPCGAEPAR
jgi:hypothetical protein